MSSSQLGMERVLEMLRNKEISPEEGSRLMRGLSVPPGEKLQENTVNNRNGDEIQQKAVAVIGISGRFPGAKNIYEFWRNLEQGRFTVSEIPKERWDIEQYYDPSPKASGKTYCRWCGSVSDADKFDPLFFSISPREAEVMDPQQRLFLEEAWKAIEDAGYAPETLSGKKCGVFAGAGQGDYDFRIKSNGNGYSSQILTGSAGSFLAARIAYFLNLIGPCITMDTACSSSLVAVHQACRSILGGECEMALAGGVSVLTTPFIHITTSKGEMLSKEGKCKAFDDSANGFVPGEGVGVVLLKPLSKAVEDGDYIYGVIRASAVNQDGKTNGITAPSANSQTRLELETYDLARVNPADISYVEAHGTGTKLGDPIEISALTRAFRHHTDKTRYCAIGSVKTNIGHGLASAGVSSLIKVLLCLKNKKLVPSLHFERPNEHINFKDSPFYVNTGLKDWTVPSGNSRMAVVSSFGLSGTNCHMLLEESPIELQIAGRVQKPCYLVPLSAKTEEALTEKARELAEWLRQDSSKYSMQDIVYTLQTGRSHFTVRIALLARDREELLQALDEINSNEIKAAPYFTDGEWKKPAQDVTSPIREEGQIIEELGRQNKGEDYRKTLSELAVLYIIGTNVNWKALYNEGEYSRIPVPAYPFARERYWIEHGTGIADTKPNLNFERSMLHPMLDVNISSLRGQKFKKALLSSEFFMKDHVVAGQILLPGAAYLEIAQAAGTRAGERQVRIIKDVLWVRPIILKDDALDIYVGINEDKNSLAYEIYSEAEGKKLVHSQGKLEYGDECRSTEKYNIDMLLERCPVVKTKKEVYQWFDDAGFNYGPSFQVTEAIYSGDREAIVKLRLPEELRKDMGEYCMHPSLMDGALRAISGIMDAQSFQSATPRIPFALGKMEIYKPLPEICYSHAVMASQGHNGDSETAKFDITVLDEDGAVIISIKDFTARAIKQNKQAEVVIEKEVRKELLYFNPSWDKKPLQMESLLNSAGQASDTMLVFDNDSRLQESFIQLLHNKNIILVTPGEAFQKSGDMSYIINPRNQADYMTLFAGLLQRGLRPSRVVCLWSLYTAGVDLQDSAEKILGNLKAEMDTGIYSVLYLFQAVSKLLADDKVRCIFAYSQNRHKLTGHHEAVFSFARSISTVNHRFELLTVQLGKELPGEEKLAQILLDEFNANENSNGMHISYKEGARYVYSLHRIDSQEMNNSGEPISLKEKGVYLITGGTGGVGFIFARYLARKYHARLILTGRSSDGAAINKKLEELREQGAEDAIYISCDVAVLESVIAVTDAIKKRWGTMDGIFHGAGVISDIAVTSADREAFEKVFLSKVIGTVNLDIAVRNENIGLFTVLSSISAFVGDFGVCSYSTGNSFMDSYIHHREQLIAAGLRKGRALSINWPLWKEGGMEIREEESSIYYEYSGMVAMSGAQGLEAFETALHKGVPQMVVACGEPHKIKKVLRVDKNKLEEAGGTMDIIETAQQLHEDAVVDASKDERLFQEAELYLKELLSKVINLPPQRINSKLALENYGIDSIMIMELNNHLEKDFDSFPRTLFFEYSNLYDLADYFVKNHAERIKKIRGLEKKSSVEVQKPAIPKAASIKQDIRPVLPTPVTYLSEQNAVSRQQAPEKRVDKEIAIIGVSGRYPMAKNLDEFWENLVSARDCIIEIPGDRWDHSQYYDPERGKLNKTYSKWGGFIDDVDKFDSMFFRISPREAESMDPQERHFLEVVWETMEDAGYTRSALSKDRVGVFTGVMYGQYQMVGVEEFLKSNVFAIGSFYSSIANRVSYYMNFNGPSMAVDTACSSALEALQLAYLHIVSGECDIAFAGGVNLSLHPSKYFSLGAANFLASDGRCRSFGEGGDGYVPGEGVGAVMLKPLKRAVEDGDHIYAVIKGIASNHGGKTNGFTVPNPNAQASLISEALKRADINPVTISCIEAHGTGTSLGDPIEISGLNKAYREYTSEKQYCSIGSVKSNVGHLESASGVAAITKVLLQLKYKKLIPSLHSKKLNPNIDFAGSPFYVQQKLEYWKQPVINENGMEKTYPRRAGISGFGAGGSNVHVILEEYTEIPVQVQQEEQVFILSARTKEQLKLYAQRMLDFIDKRMPRKRKDNGKAIPATENARKQLQAILAGLLNVSEGDIPEDEHIGVYCMDAVKLTRFIELINENYTLELGLDILSERPTIEALAMYLQDIFDGRSVHEKDLCFKEDNIINLRDMVYTLQTGREFLGERLAITASDMDELISKLEAFCTGAADVSGLYQGSSREAGGIVQLLLEGREGSEFLKIIIKDKKLDKLAQLWASGVEVDWRLLYEGNKQRRISLPTYPFARERFWVPRGEELLGVSEALMPKMTEVMNEAAVISEYDSNVSLTDVSREFLINTFSTTLKLSKDRIDAGTSFEEYGLDSIIVNHLNNTLKKYFGEIPSTLFFTYKNIERLAEYFAENHKEAVKSLGMPAEKNINAAKVAEMHVQQAKSLSHSQNEEYIKIVPVKTTGSGKSAALVDGIEDEIAIIGISGKYPMAANMNEYWENLKAGRDCISEIPQERWDYRRFYNSEKGRNGGMYCRWGGFLKDVDKFDGPFFNISPIEAKFMDPQERLFLESTWSCFEDAGYTRKLMEDPEAGDRRGPVGVFAGVTFNNYQLYANKEMEKGNALAVNSQTFSIANRISYLFNFRGPSISFDTACSSSLYAVHMACESIKRGECEMAIAGGVNLSLHPSKYMTLCAGQFAASDGRCRAFGEGGDGYVPAEAVGTVLMKPLKKAVKDGDNIYGVIKGSAVNHGGKTYGYSVPNPVAQTEVIKAAIEKSGINPRTISYVEAHGTGTSLGDPIEIRGLTDAFRMYTDEKQFCSIGSVKSNIGHGEAAAGISQLAKVVAQLKHKKLVPSLLHSDRTNPDIDLANTPFYVQQSYEDWKQPVIYENGKAVIYPRCAGISSFGVGGVNVHIIVEEYTGQPGGNKGLDEAASPVLIPLSAREESNLREYAENLGAWMRSDVADNAGIEDIAYTLQNGREAMTCRLAIIARTKEELLERLDKAIETGFSQSKPDGIYYMKLANQRKKGNTYGDRNVINGVHEINEIAGLWTGGADIDWTAFRGDTLPQRISLPTYPFSRLRYWVSENWQSLEEADIGKPLPSEVEKQKDFLAELSDTPESERYELLNGYLRKRVGEVLDFSSSKLPDIQQGFFDMGMESVQSMLLYSKIADDLKIELYNTALFDYPSIAELSRYILVQVQPLLEVRNNKSGETGSVHKSTGTYESIYYRGEWKNTGAKLLKKTVNVSRILVFDEDESLCDALGQSQFEGKIVLVKPGDFCKKVNEDCYEIDPCSPEAYSWLVKNLGDEGKLPEGIIHYWSKDSFIVRKEELEKQLESGLYSLFYLSKALMNEKNKEAIKLLYLYNGNTESIQPQFEGVGAFAKSIYQENPKYIYKTIGLGKSFSEQIGDEAAFTVELLLTQLQESSNPGAELRLAEGKIWERQLIELDADITKGQDIKPMLKDGGVYLVTGGMGGLGLIFARHIASCVKARIVLAGRSKLTAEKKSILKRFEATGSEIMYIKADISSPGEAEKLVSRIREAYGSLNGILHCAGIIRDSFIPRKTIEEMNEVLSPKVFGTIYLDEASKGENLDFFVLFSSISGVTGNAGQCDYAYANRFMDSFAQYRGYLCCKGMRYGSTTAINWPLWKNGGMKINAQIEEALMKRLGMTLLETEDGLKSFDYGLGIQGGQLGVLKAERETIIRLMNIQPGLESTGDNTAQAFIQPEIQCAASEEDIPEEISNMDSHELENELEARLKALGL